MRTLFFYAIFFLTINIGWVSAQDYPVAVASGVKRTYTIGDSTGWSEIADSVDLSIFGCDELSISALNAFIFDKRSDPVMAKNFRSLDGKCTSWFPGVKVVVMQIFAPSEVSLGYEMALIHFPTSDALQAEKITDSYYLPTKYLVPVNRY